MGDPTKNDYNKLIKEINNFNGYWYGLDNNDSGRKTNGSSILIEINVKEYIFIGSCVLHFTTDEPIIEFRSPMGNSDVIYSYAWSENKLFDLTDSPVKYLNRNPDIDVENETSVWQHGFYNKLYARDVKKLKKSKVIHKRIF